MTAPKKERRTGTLRRQANEAILGAHDEVSIAKLFGITGQSLCVWAFVSHIDFLLKDWLALSIILSGILFPEFLKKFLAMKYGGSAK